MMITTFEHNRKYYSVLEPTAARGQLGAFISSERRGLPLERQLHLYEWALDTFPLRDRNKKASWQDEVGLYIVEIPQPAVGTVVRGKDGIYVCRDPKEASGLGCWVHLPRQAGIGVLCGRDSSDMYEPDPDAVCRAKRGEWLWLAPVPGTSEPVRRSAWEVTKQELTAAPTDLLARAGKEMAEANLARSATKAMGFFERKATELKDMKEALTSSRKPDRTHVRGPLMDYVARQQEYGADKYDRGNYLRPVAAGGYTGTPTAADFVRFRAYLRAVLSHTQAALDEMERHLATDPKLEDAAGMAKAAYAEDTDVTPGAKVGASKLPHIAGAAASLNMALAQAVCCGLLPADPGTPWRDAK